MNRVELKHHGLPLTSPNQAVTETSWKLFLDIFFDFRTTELQIIMMTTANIYSALILYQEWF